MRLDPQMLDTPGHFAFTLHNQVGEEVGILWLSRGDPGNREAFWIYDIMVHPDHRRKGFGTQTLFALDAFVIEQGLDRIGLHVFGHNHGARALYDSTGYEIITVSGVKEISGD